MSERRLVVTSAVDRAIRRHGHETYPHECCGALLGRGDQVIDIVALPNTTEEGPRRRFLVRPSDYREAEQRAGELGAELLGFIIRIRIIRRGRRSTDLDHAWPTFAYVIVAVAAGAAGDMTVWYLKEDRSSFEEGSLDYGENSHPDPAQAVHG